MMTVIDTLASLLLGGAQQGSEVKDNVSVANNACWAIGEVAVKVSCYCLMANLQQ